MNKMPLILDVDDSIINSTQSFAECYNLLYKNHTDFAEADWTKCNKYDLSDIAPLQTDPLEIFSSKLFFELVKPFPNAVEVLEALTKHFDIYLCSIGTSQNIKLKLDYIEKTFPFIENILPIVNKHCIMNKSMINMENKIFIDNVASNLFSSNASIKMCYGEVKSWNEEWKGRRCSDMLDMYNKLICIVHGQNRLDNNILNHNILATFHNDIIIK